MPYRIIPPGLAAIADLDLVPHPTQMVGAGQPRRPGADHQDALSSRSARRDRPTLFDREIAKEAIKRVDRDGLVEELSIAGALAGMVTSAPVGRRKRIVFHVFAPGFFVSAGLRERQPSLDIQAGRTGVIAWRQKIDVRGTLPAHRVRALGDRGLVGRGHVLRD
jgi:hypothetical protein